MPFDTNFLELMSATITWSAYTGIDANGNPSYAAPVANIPALYEGSSTRGESALAPSGVVGRTPEAVYTVYVPPRLAPEHFRPRDKLVLDNGAITYARVVNIYQDPVEGDPGFAVIETEEYR